MENKEKPLRLALYERTSTERQEKEGTIESQHDENMQYIIKHYPNGVLLDEHTYSDAGWTGTNIERPELDRLRMDMTEDLWDVVICNDPDRIARDPYLQLIIIDELEKNGKKIEFCTTKAPEVEDEDARLMFEMRALMAKYERIRSSSRFRIGKLRKARQKKVLLSVAPYGYTLVKKVSDDVTGIKQDTHIIINEQEAQIVRKIFYWLTVDKCSLRQIVKKLHDLGVKPRRNKKGIWNTSTLGSIVRNETYIGIARYRTTEAVEPKRRLKPVLGRIKQRKTSRKIRPESDWIQIDTVPAILTTADEKKMFSDAQAQLKENHRTNTRNRINDYLLGNKIYCTCGSARTGEGPQKGKYLYYRCGSRGRDFPLSVACSHQGINARIADAAVWDELSKHLSSTELLKDQLENLLGYVKTAPDTSGVEIEVLKSQLASVKDKQDKCEEAYLDNVFTSAQFKLQSQKLLTTRNEIEKKLSKLTQASKPVLQSDLIHPSEINSVVTMAKSVLSDLKFEQKRGIILRLIDRVVGIPGELTVTGTVGLTAYSDSGANTLIQSPIYQVNSSSNHVKRKVISRHRRLTECRKIYLIHCTH